LLSSCFIGFSRYRWSLGANLFKSIPFHPIN